MAAALTRARQPGAVADAGKKSDPRGLGRGEPPSHRHRGRAALVRWRTRAKNRIHGCLAAENLRVATTDLFGRAGREWLAHAPVSSTARRDIEVQLAVIGALDTQIAGYDADVKRIAKHPDAPAAADHSGDRGLRCRFTLGRDRDHHRFHSAHELAAYAGLVPSTRSSGEKTSHGGVSGASNHWLKWVLIEAVQTLKQVPGPDGTRLGSLVAGYASDLQESCALLRFSLSEARLQVTAP